MRTDPGETVALDRYHVIADVTNPRLSPAERGRLVRQLARGSHAQPDGSVRVYSRATRSLGARLPRAGPRWAPPSVQSARCEW